MLLFDFAVLKNSGFTSWSKNAAMSDNAINSRQLAFKNAGKSADVCFFPKLIFSLGDA